MPLAAQAKSRAVSPKARLTALGLVTTLAVGVGAFWYQGDPAFTPGDQLDARERAAIQQSMQKISHVEVIPVSDEDWDAAFATLPLDLPEKRTLRETLKTSSPQPESTTPAEELTLTLVDAPILAWVTLWDFVQEDGDVVHISSAGYSMEVSLTHAPARIAIPAQRDVPIVIQGVADGGGGITMGLTAVTTQLLVITPGQAVTLPLSY